MNYGDPVKIDILQQGKPVVNVATFRAGGADCVAILLDMHSKRVVVDQEFGGPELVIGYDEHSLHLDESAEGETHITFPEFAGWEIFCTRACRYTIYLALVRRREVV